MSTKTGWSVLISNQDGTFDLQENGQIKAISQPDGMPYPQSMVCWAYLCFEPIVELVDKYQPDMLVIEETASGSKSIESQKILEYIHFLVAKMITDSKIPVIYLLTEGWRRLVGCQMTKSEKDNNKKLTKLKKAVPTEVGANGKKKAKLVYDESGKRVTKVSRKHVNIRRANEVFGKYFEKALQKKDEDLADSLLLGYAAHIKLTKKDDLKDIL